MAGTSTGSNFDDIPLSTVSFNVHSVGGSFRSEGLLPPAPQLQLTATPHGYGFPEWAKPQPALRYNQ
jgi:hypothetical protein